MVFLDPLCCLMGPSGLRISSQRIFIFWNSVIFLQLYKIHLHKLPMHLKRKDLVVLDLLWWHCEALDKIQAATFRHYCFGAQILSSLGTHGSHLNWASGSVREHKLPAYKPRPYRVCHM